MCLWLYLGSKNSPEQLCGAEGHPYCEQHQLEIDAMEQSDKDWDEIFATYKALLAETKRRRKNTQ